MINFSLRNPFAVLAATIALCLLGAAVIPGITVDILPDFRKPVVVSFFSYPGLPTPEMEKSVTARVERALTLAGHIEHQESRTVSGAAVIKVFFQPGTDPSSAMNDIVNLEASDMFHLPPGIEWPFTLRSEPSNLPVVLAAISGEGLSETELYKIGYYAVRNKMGGLQGVQIPHPFGGKFRQMMVYVDPEKLMSHQLSATDVVDAMRKANLVLAAGTAQIGDTDYQVHPVNTLPTTSDIENIVVAVRDGKPIFIRDVGRAADDAALQYNIVRVNGVRSVYCPLLREPGQNTIKTVDRIYEGIAREIPKMKANGDIPEATQIALVADQSSYIRNAMKNLYNEVILGAVLVAIVVLVFLRRIVPTLVIVSLIGLSILIGALGFAATGNTINVMTLGGLALAIGTVVDAGIVVVENIIRHQRMGKTPLTAASDGTQEVSGAILAGTATTLAVFLPAVFLTGIIKYLFEPLSFAATFTIGASYILALTVVPAFCATFIREKVRSTHHPEDSDPDASAKPRGIYGRILSIALKTPVLVALLMLVSTGATTLLWPRLGSELFPQVDAGSFELRIKTLPGTRLEKTEELVIQLEAAIREIIPEQEIDALIANIGLPVGKGAGFSTVLSSNSGPDTAYLIVNLKQQGRHTSTSTYVDQLREKLKTEFPLEQFLFVSGGIVNMALSEGIPAPISVQVSGGSSAVMRDTAEKVVNALKQIDGAVDVQIAQALEYPQFDIQVDRTRAQFMGIDQEQVAETILTSLGSSLGYSSAIWIDPSGTDFFMGVQYETNKLESLDDIRNIPLSLQTSDGPVTIPLSNIAEVKRVTIPAEISRYNISPVHDIHVNTSGRDVGSVARDVEAALASVEPGKGVSIRVRGPVDTMKTGTSMLSTGLAVGAILVYLVLMAQFKSFVDPLIIMLAVPLGIGGVLVVLFVTETTVNIQSLIGTLMMIGVVVNNSILLVEFANRQMSLGLSSHDAALSAAQIRLRPILMTSLTLVAAMLPLTLQFAPGNEAMIPLARALVGGMVVSTLLTLILVPCVYTVIHRNSNRRPSPIPE